eukprot:scaffold189194_cov17-Prasinocladus_malaysianus.AAC.1
MGRSQWLAARARAAIGPTHNVMCKARSVSDCQGLAYYYTQCIGDGARLPLFADGVLCLALWLLLLR